MSNATNATDYSVSEISQAVKRTVEDNFGYVRVRGEITGFRGPHSSGHAYFALKDDKARMEAVVWRGVYAKLKTKPEEGMEVIATGKLTTYPGSSKYQIVIEAIEPAGIGALMAQLEARRKKYTEMGVFDTDKKKPLPFLPQTIGIVTSPTGAVIRDILHRLSDRFPTHVLVWPVRVQGETSGTEVGKAIDGFNQLGDYDLPLPDLIIVARGGGSFEDLWGFNDEAVIEAVARSTLPVISAVGHETDTTLIDYVADMRAPTPTAAAEFAVPVRAELMARLNETNMRATNALNKINRVARLELNALASKLDKHKDPIGQRAQRLDVAAQNLGSLFSHYFTRRKDGFAHISNRYGPRLLKAHMTQAQTKKLTLAQNLDRLGRNITSPKTEITQRHQQRFLRALKPLVVGHQNRLQPLKTQLVQHTRHQIEQNGKQLQSANALLNSLSYTNVLKRGYSVIREQDGTIATSAKRLEGPDITIQFHDGERRAQLGKTTTPSDPQKTPGRKKSPATKKPSKDRSSQGSLF